MIKNLQAVLVALAVLAAFFGMIVLAPVHLVRANIEDKVLEVEYESAPAKDFYSKPSEWMSENLKVVDAETLRVKATEFHKTSIFPGNGSFSFDAGMRIFWVVEDTEEYTGELIARDKVKGFPAGVVVHEDVLREDWHPSYWSGRLHWDPKDAEVVAALYELPEVDSSEIITTPGPLPPRPIPESAVHEFKFTPPPGDYIALVGFRENSKLMRFKIVTKGV
ncbi:MAG: hypothetical protein HYX96_01075 [Chloroflexi bacterium]|nr:hypothetical protein [Chloroflexota bacterium]